MSASPAPSPRVRSSEVVSALRAALADALQAAGPQSPTLCEGWTAHDLAAHVVARERRPYADAGLVLAPLSPLTERARQGQRRRPFTALVDDVRRGPGAWSPFGWPGVAGLVNLVEFAVHLVDVARPAAEDAAAPHYPVPHVPGLQEAVAAQLRAQARWHRRRLPVPVEARTRDGVVLLGAPASDADPVTMIGDPLEVLLFLTGRGAHADVSLEGPAHHLETLRKAGLGI